MAASKASGGLAVESPAQTAPRERAKVCSGTVTRNGEGVDFLAIMDRYLGSNVSCGPEPIDTQVFDAFARQAVGAVTDQTGAKQGSGLDMAVGSRQREAVVLISDGEFGKAAVEGIPGETGVVTEIFPAFEAIAAATAGSAQPGDTDTVPGLEPRNSGANCQHGADDFMSQDQGQPGVG